MPADRWFQMLFLSNYIPNIHLIGFRRTNLFSRQPKIGIAINLHLASSVKRETKLVTVPCTLPMVTPGH